MGNYLGYKCGKCKDTKRIFIDIIAGTTKECEDCREVPVLESVPIPAEDRATNILPSNTPVPLTSTDVFTNPTEPKYVDVIIDSCDDSNVDACTPAYKIVFKKYTWPLACHDCGQIRVPHSIEGNCYCSNCGRKLL